MKSVHNVPKLRFSEFQGKSEWSQSFGNEVFEQINNKQHDSSLPVLAITQEHGAIPRDAIDYQVSVTEKSIESYKIVEVGNGSIPIMREQLKRKLTIEIGASQLQHWIDGLQVPFCA